MYQRIKESQGNLRKGSLLIDPVVGARRGFLAVFVDIDLEALAIAFVLPVSDRVADVV